MKKSFADIVASMENDLRRKVAGKIPSWAELEVPTALSYEQCSSEKTAAYKARFVGAGFGDAGVGGAAGAAGSGAAGYGTAGYGTAAGARPVVADLTGGLGVDSAAFASAGAKVHYFEQNAELCAAAARNFAALGLANGDADDAAEHADDNSEAGKAGSITVANTTVGPDTPLPDCDLIFMDPARRSSAGKKVFLLEDCTPNVLELLPLLWQHSGRILLKLSPMADFSLVARRLAAANMEIIGWHGIREAHIVETGGEVKELLILMERSAQPETGLRPGDIPGADFDSESGENWLSAIPITATDLVSSFTFTLGDEAAAAASFANPQPGQYIYVPSGALLKAGAYNIIGLPRLSPDSHLYLCDAPRPFGRSYLIEEVLPFSSSAIKELAGRFSHADVSAHAMPLRSEELAKRLKVKSGGGLHIFASPSPSGRILLICENIC